MSTLGFELGLSRPQRDVLPTRRCGPCHTRSVFTPLLFQCQHNPHCLLSKPCWRTRLQKNTKTVAPAKHKHPHAQSAETRDRTGDLQIFSLTLWQLSYGGRCFVGGAAQAASCIACDERVEITRKSATSCGIRKCPQPTRELCVYFVPFLWFPCHSAIQHHLIRQLSMSWTFSRCCSLGGMAQR